MLALWLLPLGYFVLNRNKTYKYAKPVNSNTGLVFNCKRIEILNKRIVYNYIDGLIEEFKRINKIFNLNNSSIIDVFEFILKKLDSCCFSKMKKRLLTQKEKIIVSLLFILIFNRFVYFVDQNIFLPKFEYQEISIIKYILNLSSEDEENIELANDQFNRIYSFP